jgi:perosamine synthetase
MAALLEVSRRRDLPIIEDAAEAIGSRWQNRPAGSVGAFGAFSVKFRYPLDK